MRLVRKLAVVLLFAAPVVQAAGTSDREHVVKAAFVFNILKFSQLPTSDIRTRDSGLLLCVLDDRPIFLALRRIAGRPVRGGNLSVAEISGPGELPLCDAVFVGTRWSGSLGELKRGALEHRVLTLTEQSSQVENGLMIGVVPNGARLGIEINVPATRAAGIRLSAELLQLSRLIGAESADGLKGEPR